MMNETDDDIFPNPNLVIKFINNTEDQESDLADFYNLEYGEQIFWGCHECIILCRRLF